MSKRKLISLLLALTLLFALASCGNGDSGGSGSPSPSQSETPSSSESPSESGPAADVDLQKFYESLLVDDPESEDYFYPDTPVEGDALATAYPGLENIATKQLVIYQPMMSAVACEIALVEVENADDVQKVKDIFQARIDAQVGTDDAPGGAWYPEAIEGWKNNSRIVSNGNYVMMIVWEKADQFVEQFNALF